MASETKKIIINPRAEIDTSPPFESVKQAVDRFGGSGPWIPHHLPPPNHETNGLNSLMFMELKLNLNKTSIDLAEIQSSVESMNKKITRDTLLLERKPDLCSKVETGPDISWTLKKMTEASRYEVIKAMKEIERTKDSIKMAEMRLNAAKKMEEAAKAVEAIAFAEKMALLDGVITLSFDEYRALSRKARQGDDLCDTKFIDKNVAQGPEEPVLEKCEESTKENTRSRDVELSRNEPCGAKEKKSITSIGDILSRKLMVQENVTVGRRVEGRSSERRHISLSQMLKEQSRLVLRSPEDGNVEKQYIVERKKFGFIQVPISIIKQKSKRKTQQPLNMS